jgi:AcrR family transcriptional regulator
VRYSVRVTTAIRSERAQLRKRVLCQDRDNPGRYLNIVFFDSYDAAMDRGATSVAPTEKAVSTTWRWLASCQRATRGEAVAGQTRRVSPARREKYLAEREAIIAAAYELIGVNGAEGTSVHDILGKVGLSTRAFYRHFPSKDELVLHMFRTDSERVAASLAAAVSRARSPQGALQAWIDEFLAVAYEPRRARHAAVLTSPEVAAAAGFDGALAESLAAQRTSLVEVLRRGREDGSFPFADPENDAYAIQAVAGGRLQARLRGEPGPSRTAARHHTLRLFLRALGASGAPDADPPTRRGARRG